MMADIMMNKLDWKRNVLSALCTALLVFCLSSLLTACATVPLTERKSLRLIPEPELLSLSNQQYSKVLQDSRLSGDPQKIQLARRVGKRIAVAAEEFLREKGQGEKVRNYQWEFNVIDDDKLVNAWCMPGGKLAVYTGILPITRDETGLAVVLGHEVAHAIAEHGNERMSEALVAQLGGLALSVALNKQPEQTRQIFMAAYGVTANVAFKAIQATGKAQAALLARAAQIAIVVLVAAIALRQMGLADEIINLAFGLLLAAVAAAVAIAFGIGGRELAARQLDEWVKSKKTK